ncbi:MAG TPA: ABC transporter ATP-binding protein [Candidatus Limnocylindria bacterium]|nr:ABC transporter ATP-binding protein [Candidatus Limnocylindria bacterium]
MTAGPAIETHGLTKRFRRKVAVRELTVSIPIGGITALLGPNGAGKSTLLKMCVGFERPSGGTLRVFGVDPVRRRRDVVDMLGYVPQAPSLYRDMKVEDHLRLCRALRPGFDIDHARERVVALGIPPTATAGHLSGGEQAQVSLAIALGTRAPLLLLDEPLASLDPLARREFLEVASDAARGGDVSIVLSSHVISEIEPVADRLLVLGEGRVLFEDSVAASLGQHRVLDDGAPVDGLDVVARFPGQGNARHLLVRSSDPAVGRPGSLEEVVIGYLALGKRAA